ncbi:hypothetical protein [Pseudomonas orientalis]|uniref:hypothetical protein n=1 Tax=Pseudomonas orientalis TaxID=76758 RepID=UPI0034D50479
MLVIREDQIEETALNNYSHIYVGNRIAQDATLIHEAKIMAPLASRESEGMPLIKEAVITVDNPNEEAVTRVQAKVLAKLKTYRK